MHSLRQVTPRHPVLPYRTLSFSRDHALRYCVILSVYFDRDTINLHSIQTSLFLGRPSLF